MKSALTIIFALGSSLLFSQTTVYWIGGTPGHETEWNNARNWSNNEVPDVFTDVVINGANSGHNAQPVIDQDVEVLSIKINNGGSLKVLSSGSITIDGKYFFTEGICIAGGKLLNDGNIMINSSELEYKLITCSELVGSGTVSLNGIVANSDHYNKLIAYRKW